MEVLVVGAGVVGCAVAWRLQQAGARCTVLERCIPGAEASSAAGGILAPQTEADGPGPFLDLCLASRALYPAFARRARRGESTWTSPSASAGCSRSPSTRRRAPRCRRPSRGSTRAGSRPLARRRGGARARARALARGRRRGALPRRRLVDNRQLVSALTIAAARAGARFRHRARCAGCSSRAGAWSASSTEGELRGRRGGRGGGRLVRAGPRRALLDPRRSAPRAVRWRCCSTRVPLCRHVRVRGARVPVPARGWRGSSPGAPWSRGLRQAGHRVRARPILAAALQLFPGLAGAPVTESWAGLPAAYDRTICPSSGQGRCPVSSSPPGISGTASC